MTDDSMTIRIFHVCPCGFVIHRVLNSGSVTRADNISAITASGIANPRGQCKTILCRGLACLSPECTGRADTRSTPTGNTQGVAHVLMSSASVRLSLWICKSPKTQDTRTQNPLIIKSWIRRSATAGECTLLTSACLF